MEEGKKIQDEKPQLKENKEKLSEDQFAIARGVNLPISTKFSTEVCRSLRGKRLERAKILLNQVIKKKRAIPYKRYLRDRGHKPGMAAGGYPLNTSLEMLKLLNLAEANADHRGLDTKKLVIKEIHASIGQRFPRHGRHVRRKNKRTNVHVKLVEGND